MMELKTELFKTMYNGVYSPEGTAKEVNEVFRILDGTSTTMIAPLKMELEYSPSKFKGVSPRAMAKHASEVGKLLKAKSKKTARK